MARRDQAASVVEPARNGSLDALRGFAILAILLINIQAMGGYALAGAADPRMVSWTTADQVTVRLLGMGVDGAMRGVLELLFGAGIMMLGSRPGGLWSGFGAHLRRNGWLMAFGVFHALVLLWPQDILLPYGAVAIVAYPARRLRPLWQAIAGAAFILLAVAPAVDRFVVATDLREGAAAARATQASAGAVTPADQARLAQWQALEASLTAPHLNPAKQQAAAVERAGRQGGPAAYAEFLRGLWLRNFHLEALAGWSEILGTMLLGMALYGWGVLQGGRSARFYLWLAAAGFAVGVPLRGFADVANLRFRPDPDIGWITWDMARIALTLGHVGWINLACKLAPASLGIRALQAAGRMPLTIYLSASLICLWLIFPAFGLGLFGKLGWAGLEGVALIVIGLQLALACAWTKAFTTGPADWLWKSLAEGRRRPLRRSV